MNKRVISTWIVSLLVTAFVVVVSLPVMIADVPINTELYLEGDGVYSGPFYSGGLGYTLSVRLIDIDVTGDIIDAFVNLTTTDPDIIIQDDSGNWGDQPYDSNEPLDDYLWDEIPRVTSYFTFTFDVDNSCPIGDHTATLVIGYTNGQAQRREGVIHHITIVISSLAKTLYVGGTGMGNYTHIRHAIENASDGDTVFVYDDSAPYYENVVVNKTINLIGEATETTIIDGGGSGDVVRVVANWVNITGFTVTGSGGALCAGIRLDNVQNCKLDNNIIIDNEFDGIAIYSSSNNTILNNIVSNNYEGVYLFSSSNNNITDNAISNNSGGIGLSASPNNIISSNNFVNDGVYIFGTQVSHYNSHSIPENNIVNGKPLYYYKDCNYMDINGILVGQLILANCTQLNVENIQIENTDGGIEVAYSKNINLTNNNFSANNVGIRLKSTSSSNITGNTIISNNGQGIYLESSSKNIIKGNNVSNNWMGISYFLSSNNNIIGNNVSDNGYGIRLIQSSKNNLTGNFVSSNGIDAITLRSSSDNNITGNIITSSYGKGIHLDSSSNNITYNNILNNGYGVYLESSSNTRIYHNNIISNSNQAYDDCIGGNLWDNGYPSGGNYWYDYDGVDEFQGPGQNIPGKDGIGDTRYMIDDDSIDNYPLMEPIPDTLAPRIQLISPSNNSVIQPGVMLDFYIYDGNIDYINHSIDNGPEEPFLYPYNISTTDWDDGIHTVFIRATDTNENIASESFYFTLDSIKPIISLYSPENNSIIQAGTILDFSVIDSNLKEGNYSINGETNISLSEPFNITTIDWADGDYTVQINALDLAGNSNSSWYFFTIDSTEPVIHLNSPGNNSVILSGTPFEFSIMDSNLFQTNYSINEGPDIPFSDPFDIFTTGWPDGDYIVQVNALDLAGNPNSSWFFFTINSMPSTIADVIVSPFPQKVNGYVNISANVSDPEQIDTIRINVTDPNGITIGNFTMANISATNRYYMNQTYNIAGTYQFIIWVTDISDYCNSTKGVFVIATEPDAPIGLMATAGDSYVNITWKAPNSDGGLPITNYVIYRGTISGQEIILIDIGNVLFYNDTSVINGVTYHYRVSAKNAIGEGLLSNEANATPIRPSDQDRDFSWWLWIIIAIVIAVILIGFLVVYMILKKKKEQQP